MDTFTKKHLETYVGNMVPDEHRADFVKYVNDFFEKYPDECLDKGWGKLWCSYPSRFWE